MNGQGERKEKIKPASEVGARLAGLWKKTGARIVNAAKALDPSLPEGAAPSYLRRGDKIYSLSSKSVPLGIIGELDAGKTEFAVEPGDMILMISDGVLAGTDGDEDGSYVWLLDLLSSCDARHLDETARRALRMARIAGSRDDASAAVIAIGEMPPSPGEGA